MNIVITKVSMSHLTLEDITKDRVDEIVDSFQNGDPDPLCLEDLAAQSAATDYLIESEDSGKVLWPRPKDDHDKTWHKAEDEVCPEEPGLYRVLLRPCSQQNDTVVQIDENENLGYDYWDGASWERHRLKAILAWTPA